VGGAIVIGPAVGVAVQAVRAPTATA